MYWKIYVVPTVSLYFVFLLLLCLVLFAAIHRQCSSNRLESFFSRDLFSVQVWQWEVSVKMKMQLINLALVSTGMFLCFRSGVKWYLTWLAFCTLVLVSLLSLPFTVEILQRYFKFCPFVFLLRSLGLLQTLFATALQVLIFMPNCIQCSGWWCILQIFLPFYMKRIGHQLKVVHSVDLV